MDIVLFATAWGPRHGGINAFNHDLALGLTRLLRERGRVFCAVLNPSEADVAQAEADGVQLIPIEKPGSSDCARMDPDWVGSVCRWRDEKRLTFGETSFVGHDVVSGALALNAAKVVGGKAAVIQHMSYDRYQAVKDTSGKSAMDKAAEQRRVIKGASEAALFGVGPLLVEQCSEHAAHTYSNRVVPLIPGFPVAGENEASSNRLTALTFGRLGAEDDRIKLGLLAAKAFSEACSKDRDEPDAVRCFKGARLNVIGIEGGSESELEFKQKAAPSRLRTHCPSQKMTMAARVMAPKKVVAHLS